jgi:hypothetical protein
MGQIVQITKAILSENNYKERLQKILEFVQNYFNKKVLKMEYLIDELNEKGDMDSKDSKENQEKYVNLKKARMLVNHDINALMKIIDMVEQMDDKSFENMEYTEDVKTNVNDGNKVDLDDLDTTSETTEDHEYYDIPYDVNDDVDDIQEFDEIDEDDDTYGFSYHKRKNGKY